MEPATQKIFSHKKSRMQWYAWLVFAAAFFTVSSCARFNDDIALSRYEFNKPEMGLPFRIVLYAKSDEQARTSAFAAFARIEQLNGILSDYDPDSELSKLSRTSGSGQAMKVSGDLWSVLNQSQELAERSRGAFDATVGPAVNLWRKARREKKMPDKDELAKAKAAMGWENLRLNSRNHTVELLVPNMRLDLGGIAKGYAVDEAMKILRQHGIRSALIAGGGDMAVGDAPPGKSGWTVEIAPIDSPKAPP
jgi:thiamine biosynthesis lipoprotein